MRILACLFTAAVVTGCGNTAMSTSSASAPASSLVTPAAPATPSTSASATPSAFVSPSISSRIGVSDAPIGTSAGPLILFQMPGDDRLRGVTWDGALNGLLGARTALATWRQSPDGSRYAVGGTVYAADGTAIGAVPWDRVASFGWSGRSDLLCAALPDTPQQTGARMLLEIAGPGGTPRRVATGFTTYGDNSGYPVLACDTESDRAIVGVFGQGLFAARVYVFKLSTGEVLDEIDAPSGVVGAWAAASSDGTLIAYSTRVTATAGSSTVVSRADDGAELARFPGFEAHGFSGDGSLIYGSTASTRTFEVREWRTGTTVWTATGYPYGGFYPEPRGNRLAVLVSLDNMLTDADVYIVSSAGGILGLLPRGVKTSFRY